MTSWVTIKLMKYSSRKTMGNNDSKEKKASEAARLPQAWWRNADAESRKILPMDTRTDLLRAPG